MLLEVYVPNPSSVALRNIAPGSAIVGRLSPPGEAERVTIYYEGGIYGQYATLKLDDRFAHFLEIAAGRLVTRYPTIAMMSVPATELRRVGTYDDESKTLVVNNSDLLDEWKGKALAEK